MITVIGGLIVATLLSLVLIAAVFVVMDDIGRSRVPMGRPISALKRQGQPATNHPSGNDDHLVGFDSGWARAARPGWARLLLSVNARPTTMIPRHQLAADQDALAATR